MLGQELALPANVGHRRHFPERALRNRTDREQTPRDRARAAEQRTRAGDIETEPECIRARRTVGQQRPDQRIRDAVVVGGRAGAVDNPCRVEALNPIRATLPEGDAHRSVPGSVTLHAGSHDA